MRKGYNIFSVYICVHFVLAARARVRMRRRAPRFMGARLYES